MVGPLDRGHEPVGIVLGVAVEETPTSWTIDAAESYAGPWVLCDLTREDGKRLGLRISFDTINKGMTRHAVRRGVEKLSRHAS